MNEREESTEHLAGRARTSEQGFAALYDRIAPALHAWASLRLRPSLALSPEDVVQETWFRALRSFANFDPARGRFRTWVFTIATRVLINAMRSASRRPEGDPSPLLSGLPEEATQVSERARRDERALELIRLIRTLSPEDRTLAVHVGLEDAPLAEVAARLDISAEAAKKRWQRLRARLREELPSSEELFG